MHDRVPANHARALLHINSSSIMVSVRIHSIGGLSVVSNRRRHQSSPGFDKSLVSTQISMQSSRPLPSINSQTASLNMSSGIKDQFETPTHAVKRSTLCRPLVTTVERSFGGCLFRKKGRCTFRRHNANKLFDPDRRFSSIYSVQCELLTGAENIQDYLSTSLCGRIDYDESDVR